MFRFVPDGGVPSMEMVVDHPIAILARTRSDYKFGEVLSSGIGDGRGKSLLARFQVVT